MNKFLLTTALAGAVVFTAAAEEGPKMSITGSIDSKFVNTHQRDEFRKVLSGSDQGKKIANNNIATDAYINFNIKGEVKDGLKYGGLIKLNANTSKSKKEVYLNGKSPSVAEQVMAFLESGYGRVEVGNYTGVSESMKVNAGTFASATGGINGDAQYYWNAQTAETNTNTKDAFVQTANLPTNELGTFGLRGVNAAKLNYYTPEFSGFRFGATFIPNTKAFGTASETTQILNDKTGFKNVFEAGLSYTTEVKEVGVKLAAVSQFGKNQNDANKNLRAYEVGTNLSYKGFTVGGSYGDWGKYDVVEKNASEFGKTKYWTAGVGYANGPLSVSLTHLQSKKGVSVSNESAFNKLRNTVLGVDYKVAPGVLPYVEFSSFKMNQASVAAADKDTKNNKGHIIMTGIKLNF
jgi:hypothetical protein